MSLVPGRSPSRPIWRRAARRFSFVLGRVSDCINTCDGFTTVDDNYSCMVESPGRVSPAPPTSPYSVWCLSASGPGYQASNSAAGVTTAIAGSGRSLTAGGLDLLGVSPKMDKWDRIERPV